MARYKKYPPEGPQTKRILVGIAALVLIIVIARGR